VSELVGTSYTENRKTCRSRSSFVSMPGRSQTYPTSTDARSDGRRGARVQERLGTLGAEAAVSSSTRRRHRPLVHPARVRLERALSGDRAAPPGPRCAGRTESPSSMRCSGQLPLSSLSRVDLEDGSGSSAGQRRLAPPSRGEPEQQDAKQRDVRHAYEYDTMKTKITMIAAAVRQRPTTRSSRVVRLRSAMCPSRRTLCRNDTTDGRGKNEHSVDNRQPVLR
jgi:hypothetical protein